MGATALNIEEIVPLDGPIHIADIGAACINETPCYEFLLERRLAHLSAFDGDPRQRKPIVEKYGSQATVYTEIVGDGKAHTLYLTAAQSGMSSLLKFSQRHLNFFNGFPKFAEVLREETVQSKRLDDIEGVGAIDFLKIDIEALELTVLQNAERVLENCVAIQIEVWFVPFHEGQPTFGDVDIYMRSKGYLPHCFETINRWSIAPTILNGDFRNPFKQLLTADIVYIKDPIYIEKFSNDQLKKLCYIAQYSYGSTDLAVLMLLELEKRVVFHFSRLRSLRMKFSSTIRQSQSFHSE